MPNSENDNKLKAKLKAVKKKKAQRERQVRKNLSKADPREVEDVALKLKLLKCIDQIIDFLFIGSYCG
jgi:hypothetical protein